VNKSKYVHEMSDLLPADGCGVPSRFWVIADTHFFHHNIYGYSGRPPDAEERMVAAWRRVVAPEDTVVHVGDLALGHADQLPPVVASLPGRMLLIPGNHDRSPARYEGLGIRVIPAFFMPWGEWTVSFSHYPQPHLADQRHLNVHGHIHEQLEPDLHLINVGVEWTDYAPVRIDTLLDTRIEALNHTRRQFSAPLGYGAWLTATYGPVEEALSAEDEKTKKVQALDVHRFPDITRRTAVREAYTQYRRGTLARALAAEQ
jgi:calcineurin-like phosphoesterase family protein